MHSYRGGSAQAPRGDGTDSGCVGSGKWNLPRKSLLSCHARFHTFMTARSHFLLYIVISECFLCNSSPYRPPNTTVALRLCSWSRQRWPARASAVSLANPKTHTRALRRPVVAMLKPKHPERKRFACEISTPLWPVLNSPIYWRYFKENIADFIDLSSAMLSFYNCNKKKIKKNEAGAAFETNLM